MPDYQRMRNCRSPGWVPSRHRNKLGNRQQAMEMVAHGLAMVAHLPQDRRSGGVIEMRRMGGANRNSRTLLDPTKAINQATHEQSWNRIDCRSPVDSRGRDRCGLEGRGLAASQNADLPRTMWRRAFEAEIDSRTNPRRPSYHSLTPGQSRDWSDGWLGTLRQY